MQIFVVEQGSYLLLLPYMSQSNIKRSITSFDIDDEALNQCNSIIQKSLSENPAIKWVAIKKNLTDFESMKEYFKKFDIIIMNPPFGCWEKNADMKIMEIAIHVI